MATELSIFERIIAYQNKSEKRFEGDKSISTTFHYSIAFIIFITSTILAGITLPGRFIYKKMSKADVATQIVHLNENNIDKWMNSNRVVLIDFWAEWCGPCVMMNSTIERFADTAENVKVGKVNADLNSKLVERFKIKGLPQFILLVKGKEVKRFGGPMTVFDLTNFCNLTD